MADRIVDPDLYAELAAPRASGDAAKAALSDFLEAVAELRKVHRIPEVLIVAVVHHTEGDGKTESVANMLARGNSGTWPMLAALAYKEYALPAIESAETLKRIARGEGEKP